MADTPKLNAPDPADVPKADASKEPPAQAQGGSAVSLVGGSFGGKSEGTPSPEILAKTEPGRATALAGGVGGSLAPPQVPAAVPADTMVPPAQAVVINPEIAQVTQAGHLAADGRHPYQMSEAERARLPIITNRDAEDAIAERLLGDTGQGTDPEAAGNAPQGKFIKVKGVVGTFGNVVFGNDNITRQRATPQDISAVRQHFPNANIEELDEHPNYEGVTDTQRKLMESGRLPGDLRFGGGPSHLFTSPPDARTLNAEKTGVTGTAGSVGAKGAVSETGGADELPDDFPHRDLLVGSEFKTASSLENATHEDLTAIDGIGDVRADEILAARKKLGKK